MVLWGSFGSRVLRRCEVFALSPFSSVPFPFPRLLFPLPVPVPVPETVPVPGPVPGTVPLLLFELKLATFPSTVTALPSSSLTSSPALLSISPRVCAGAWV